MGSFAPPAVTATGLTIPNYPAIKAFINSSYSSIFGSTTYLQPDSPDDQFNSVLALQIADLCQALQAVWLSFNLQSAIGTSLDLLGKLIGTERNQATNSTVIVTIAGTPSTVVNNGVVQDITGNLWNLPSTVTIPSGGSINVTATAQGLGPITANPGAVNAISQGGTAGWSSVTNAGAATPGVAVEADSQYRARLMIAQAKPSLSLVAGTAAAIAAVADVTRSQVYENQYGYTTSYGLINTSGTAFTITQGYPLDATDVGQTMVIGSTSYTIATVTSGTTGTLGSSAGSLSEAEFYVGDSVALGLAHSITCIVEGGSTISIANAIYGNKNPGVLTNGTTHVTVIDPLNGNISIVISFDILTYVEVYVGLSVQPLAGYTSATTAAIAAAITTYLNSLGIGEVVVYSQLYAAASSAQPNQFQPSFSIKSLISGTEAAQTTGTLVASSPNVTLVSGTGTANGQYVVGAGVPFGTTISSGGGTTSIVLSANATAGGSGVPLSFFNTGTSDLPVGYASAAQSQAANVQVTVL